jgi:hypothetical protein
MDSASGHAFGATGAKNAGQASNRPQMNSRCPSEANVSYWQHLADMAALSEDVRSWGINVGTTRLIADRIVRKLGLRLLEDDKKKSR